MTKSLSNKKSPGRSILNIELPLTPLTKKERLAFLAKRSIKPPPKDQSLNIRELSRHLSSKNILLKKSSTKLEESQEDSMLLSVKRLSLKRKLSRLERRQRPEDKSFNTSRRLSANLLKKSFSTENPLSSKEFMKLSPRCSRFLSRNLKPKSREVPNKPSRFQSRSSRRRPSMRSTTLKLRQTGILSGDSSNKRLRFMRPSN